MKRLVLIVVAVAALASFNVTAQTQSPSANAPTFAKDVAPIMYGKCANCHRPGEVAPMSLLSYEDARPWAKAIKTKVMAREMPPWGADMSQTLPMRNDISLSQKEIDTIAAWVDGGAAKGNAADMPPSPKFATGWTNGTEPDLVLEMPVEFDIPAEGELGVQMFYSKVPWTEDKFAEIVELKPSNRAVLHHAG
ncbi:MAG TPA: cytochrome c, partial [Vicinamibacterales bacterium]|nr:cytochrome c [Vicinamibacterales bacterium]